MQAHRHINFDERVLYYGASTYARQISEEEFQDPMWYRNLHPVIAIQVLGYDTQRCLGIHDKIPDSLVERAKKHPMQVGQFMKHYILTDKYSGQEIRHLQIIQIELPRARENVFPPHKDFNLMDWWLSIFKFAPLYTQEAIRDFESQGIIMPDVIAQALERLYFPKWNPRILHEYKSDTIEKEKYVLEFATERAEGREEGIEEGRAQGKEEVALSLIKMGLPLEDIAQGTSLSIKVVRQLAQKVNHDDQ